MNLSHTMESPQQPMAGAQQPPAHIADDAAERSALTHAPRPPALLLPVDGSLASIAAARYVVRYAKALGGASCTVLHVLPGSGRPEQAADPVGSALALLGAAGIHSTWQIENGDAAEVILAFARHADEVVMGRSGLGRIKELLVGSVTQKIAHVCPRPVTVVGSDALAVDASASDSPGSQRILLAVDGSPASLRAVDYVRNLARLGTAPVIELTTVVGPLPPGYLWDNITPERLELHYQQEGNRALFAARAALQTAGLEFNEHVVVGYAIDRLIESARARDCSRIVMGSHGRDGVAGLALGSVAYRAVHLSPLPVTIVK